MPGILSKATDVDAAEILVLQRCCWVQEAVLNDTLDIPALHESLADVRSWLSTWTTWCLRMDGRLIAGVRARSLAEDEWEIGRLMVAPDFAGRGIGRELLAVAEGAAPASTRSFVLFTGARSTRNITMYGRAGYRIVQPPEEVAGHIVGAVFLRKERP